MHAYQSSHIFHTKYTVKSIPLNEDIINGTGIQINKLNSKKYNQSTKQWN